MDQVNRQIWMATTCQGFFYIADDYVVVDKQHVQKVTLKKKWIVPLRIGTTCQILTDPRLENCDKIKFR